MEVLGITGADIWLFGKDTYEMRRIVEELDRAGKSYEIFGWRDLVFPLERYPKYVMILFLDIMQYRDDLIYGLCVLEEMTRAGVRILPPLRGFYNSDKFSNYLLWYRYLRNVIQMPDTFCGINFERGVEFLNKYQKILFKPIAGSQGMGIEIVETERRLKELLEQYHALFLQQIIPDRGYDIRTIAIGDKVIFQYARYNPNRLRKNIHLGAVAISQLDDKSQRVSTSTITALGHKDDVVAQRASYKICKSTKRTVCSIAGIHVNNITEKEIAKILLNVDGLVEELTQTI